MNLALVKWVMTCLHRVFEFEGVYRKERTDMAMTKKTHNQKLNKPLHRKLILTNTNPTKMKCDQIS